MINQYNQTQFSSFLISMYVFFLLLYIIWKLEILSVFRKFEIFIILIIQALSYGYNNNPKNKNNMKVISF